jgi:hypothetical protein
MSTPGDDLHLPDSLSEDEAHRVLARAVELDARTVSDVSVSQLRSVAEEAGIAPEALERALLELRAGRLPGVHSAHSRRSALAEQLRRFRRHAALAIAVGVAATTPGDIFVLNALYALPLFALYELCIRLLDARARGGPSSPVVDGQFALDDAPAARPPAPTPNSRSLSLRLKGLPLLSPSTC